MMYEDSSNGLVEHPFPLVEGGGYGVDDPHVVLGPIFKVLLLCLKQLRCRRILAGDDGVSAGHPDDGAHPFFTDPAGQAGAGSNWDHVWSLPGLGTVFMLYMDMTLPLWAGPLG